MQLACLLASAHFQIQNFSLLTYMTLKFLFKVMAEFIIIFGYSILSFKNLLKAQDIKVHI